MKISERMEDAVYAGVPAGLYKVLLAIQAQAIRLAPVDKGKLKQSISIATNKIKEGAVMLEAPTEDMAGVVGTNLEYAAAVEFGRPDDMPNYPMQPYLRPAAMVIKAKLGNYFTPSLKEAIAEMCRKRRAATKLKRWGINK